MSNVVYLQKPPPRIAHYLRVGYREHVLADRMRAEGRIEQLGVVFDACYVDSQRDVLEEFRIDGRELIMDTNVAEQSVLGRFASSVSNAPWANKNAPLEREDFKAGTNRSVIEPIARFAMANEFHTVLNPAHYLGGGQQFWFEVDLKSCEAMRIALDRHGGQGVGIKYPLIPIVMDRMGGLPAYALASIGITSGYCNGMKGRDTFQARDGLDQQAVGAEVMNAKFSFLVWTGA